MRTIDIEYLLIWRLKYTLINKWNILAEFLNIFLATICFFLATIRGIRTDL